MVVQCTSAGKVTGPRTIGELLKLNKVHREKTVRKAASDTPKDLWKLRSSALKKIQRFKYVHTSLHKLYVA